MLIISWTEQEIRWLFLIGSGTTGRSEYGSRSLFVTMEGSNKESGLGQCYRINHKNKGIDTMPAAVGVVVAETPPWPGGVCSMGELERTAGLENEMNVLAL